MNQIIKISIAVIFAFVSLNSVYAQRNGKEDSIFIKPTYTLKATNVVKTQPNILEWEVYLKHTNHDSTVYIYAAAQYFFNFNPAIANGGNLTFTIIAAGLPDNQLPVSPSISGNILRLASNLPTIPELSPMISDTGSGTRILKLRLKTSAASFTSDSFLLSWRSASPNPFTKLSAFTGEGNQIIVDISTPATHSIDPYTNIIPEPVTAYSIPTEYALSQNFPNPFNPSTQIDYAIPVSGNVSILVYDLAGRQITKLVNAYQTAGFYSVNFNASNLASGMYFYRINVEGEANKNYKATKRMVLIK